MAASGSAIELPEKLADDLGTRGEGWIVTVYDNDDNTVEDVMLVLMKATGCSSQEAYIETWEIDHYGLCVVHRACELECTKAAEIIATIGIRVEVSPDE